MRSVFLSLILLSLASCALSPQQMNLTPSLSVTSAGYGNQRTINVLVEDHRSSPVIGTRGGIYPNTSTIEIGNDYCHETARVIAEALRRWDFQPQLNGTDPDAVRLVLGIEKISYYPDSNPALGKMHIAVTLSLAVDKGKQRYQGQYSANGEMAYVVASASKNEDRINEIFDLALQKAFSDKGLIEFLR